MRKKILLMLIVAFIIISSSAVSRATDEDLWSVTTEPDALIVLDLSGSMQWLPHGSSPTFYSCGGSCSEPYYASPIVSTTPATLYVEAASCSADGPYTTTPPSGDSMPTSNPWVIGSDCSIDGPFSLTRGSNPLNVGNDVYISSSSSCSYDGPFYENYSWYPNRRKSCSVSSYLPNTVYTASNCSDGPFYKTSGSGHTTACYKYRQCPSFAPGYTASNCSDGPFYRTSGSGHTTECTISSTCTTPAIVYTESDCSTGPFYKTSGAGHTTICQNCSTACSVNGTNYRYSDTASCEGPFYNDNDTGTRTECSKIKIAKRALYELFDDTDDNSIAATDVTSLGMRIGMMRYYNCGSQDNDTSHTDPWNYGCIKLSWSMTASDNTTTTPYAKIYCNDTTCTPSVASCTSTDPAKECVAGYGYTGGTPIGDALREAKSFLAYHEGLDTAASCRQKSIILITDGEDTFSCPNQPNSGCGDGSTTCSSQRRAPIYYAKKAAEAGYKVYVVGFGADMPANLQDTLNWAAWYGQTRNPNATQSGDTSAVTVGANPCNSGTDPAGKTLRGYAFMAGNPDELVSAVRTALTMIQEATYSFSSQASVAAARVQEENYIYEASFEPKNNSGASKEPFWKGHLKKYQIGDDGAIITPHCWDAGEQLADRNASDRSMWTLKNGSMTLFNTSNITAADLAVADDNTRNLVVGFYRGESVYNLENWKMGDLFHTNPVTVKTPSDFSFDPRECLAVSYEAFKEAHSRTAADGNQLVIVGANDGQLHAFRSGNGTDCSSGGEELWSFIPPNLLQKLSPIAHNDHTDRTSLSSHDFFIDGPLHVTNVWLPASWSSGITKSSSDWKTLLTFGEGQGSGAYLWSSSSNCYSTSATAFSATYDATNYPYYCGFYAMDVTNSTATTPTYLWHLMPSSSQAPYLGQAWSKMQTGRIKVGGEERWVGFIGGGYSAATCSGDCSTPALGSAGKGFFIVDLRNGNIIWDWTAADDGNFDFSAPASPLPVDLDNDGFIDTVYMGDLGGNIWRFRLCPKDAVCNECNRADYTSSPCTSCTTSGWTGSRLFTSTSTERGSGMVTPSNTHKQIFTMVKATWDDNHNLWIFFGTGENNDPIYKPTDADPDTSETKNRLYAIKEDPNYTATYNSSQLENITSSRYTDAPNKHGWYINLSTNSLTRSDGTTISSPKGEKMISDPAIAGGYVYYATYVPDQGEDSACGQSGDAFMYKLNYQTGAGANADPDDASDIGTRASYMGHGIGSSILVSYAPGYTDLDIYATASGGAGTGALTQTMGKGNKDPNMIKVLYWKDRRLQ